MEDIGSDSSKDEAIKQPEPHSVLAVIGAGRWKSALFTSFTLSLTYVESYVLPALRRSGCERVTILADSAGYRDSLVEQRSLGVGRDYSVIPVRVKGGIFHPKLVYLEEADGLSDVLLVGSGNMTYPGSGGNIEVLDVLRPSTCASAFNACAKFFEELGEHERVQLPNSAALKDTIARMRAVAATGQDTGDAQFVHCLRTSGLDQFVAAAQRAGGRWRELLVLSPYHHPQAEPVLLLAERLGVTEIAVGVSSREGEPTAFSFSEARKRFPIVRAVAPVPAAKPERNLHAKWFEVRGDAATVALTGSFNATQASFANVANVECGVIRTLPAATTCWKDVPEPAYQKGEFPQRSDAQAPCVFAVIARGGTLEGTVLGPGSAGLWQLTLESADEVLSSKQVLVNEQGQFQVEFEASFDATRTGTLQVTLVRGVVRASGWVQIAQLLRLDARHRRLLDIIRRAASGNQSSSDMQDLLDIVAQQTSSIMAATFAPKTSATGTKTEAPAQVISTSAFNSFTPEGPSGTHESASLLQALNSGATGLDLLEHLFVNLLPRSARTEKGDQREPRDNNPFRARVQTTSAEAEAEGEESNEKGEKGLHKLQQKREKDRANLHKVYGALRERLTEINSALGRRPDNVATLQNNKLRFLKVWLGLVLVYEVGELGDLNEARAFLCGLWMQEVCSVRASVEGRMWLADDVCGVAAVLAFKKPLQAASPKRESCPLSKAKRCRPLTPSANWPDVFRHFLTAL